MIAARSGDSDIFDDYASWLPTTTPEELGPSVLEYFEPMEKYSTNEVLQAAADKLFSATNLVWGKLPWTGIHENNPAASDLVQVPAFRELLARELMNQTPCGTVQWGAPNWISFQLTNDLHLSSGSRTSFPAGEQPADGARETLRWCDWIAWSLSSGNHMPFFNPFAPQVKRNESIQKDRQLLLEH